MTNTHLIQELHSSTRMPSLSARIFSLAEEVERKGRDVRCLGGFAGTLDLGDRRITFKDFSSICSKTLSDYFEKVLTISKRAVAAVFAFDDVQAHLNNTHQLIDTMQGMADSADNLVRDTMLDAVHMGEPGDKMILIADEVRKLSDQVRKLALDIRQSINLTGMRADSGHQLIRDLAATDMSDTMIEQDKMVRLLDNLIRHNHELCQKLGNSARDVEIVSEQMAFMAKELKPVA